MWCLESLSCYQRGALTNAAAQCPRLDVIDRIDPGEIVELLRSGDRSVPLIVLDAGGRP